MDIVVVVVKTSISKMHYNAKHKNSTTMTEIDQIDEILMRFEDWMHGNDGDDVTKARKILNEMRSVVLADVMPSAYIMKLDRETTIVIADNIAEAMDKAEENGAQDYEMSYCRTIPILH